MPTHQTTVSDQPGSILIAEDEHLLAANLSRQLGELGFRVVGPVANGRAALELAERDRPDLALLDLCMPEMDGIEAARVLYEKHHVPVVVLTAHSDDSYVNSAQNAGVFGYLLKPTEGDRLRVAIRIAWGRYQDQQKLSGDVDKLERKLEERKIIERAKGLLMQKLQLSEPDAMKRLQKQARDNRRPMAELARSIIEAEQMMGQ
ncbi:MAG: response regulator [Phycisphaeraceae bacterium]|nr:response regulator [Phycisphaeraceae bacterium]